MGRRVLGGVDGDKIVVYVDSVFVRLALDGVVLIIIHFRIDLISVSSFDHFLLQTFFISDFNAKQDPSSSSSLTKPARACDACYDAVFRVECDVIYSSTAIFSRQTRSRSGRCCEPVITSRLAFSPMTQ